MELRVYGNDWYNQTYHTQAFWMPCYNIIELYILGIAIPSYGSFRRILISQRNLTSYQKHNSKERWLQTESELKIKMGLNKKKSIKQKCIAN